MRHWKEECGVVGVAGTDSAAELVSLALYALQHRGQEGSGIVSFDDGALRAHRGLGLVSDVYTADALAGLDGTIAVGHNRYSTTGSCSAENLQPIVAHSRGSTVALSHNGNLVNALALRNSLEDQGAIFQTTMDSEVIVHMMARSRQHAFEDRVREALGRVVGAYSVILSDGQKLIGARDPRGFRPLCIGKLGNAHILASESCALDLLGAEYLREVAPGELVVIEGERFWSIPSIEPVEPKHCIFEYIYFSRPDSVVFGHAVDPVRRRLGRALAEEHPADADLVIAVPDSSNSAALGFSEHSKIPFEIGLIRNHYVGRTFIQPTARLRDLRVKIKYNAVKDVLNGKRVVVVDDSIVRGTTMKKLVKMLKKAGASEVHLRISSPPIQHPCYYGIDTPTRGELLAATHTIEEIRRYLEVEDVEYLSRESLLRAAPQGLGYCTACFDGEYSIPVDEQHSKEILERNPA